MKYAVFLHFLCKFTIFCDKTIWIILDDVSTTTEIRLQMPTPFIIVDIIMILKLVMTISSPAITTRPLPSKNAS